MRSGSSKHSTKRSNAAPEGRTGKANHLPPRKKLIGMRPESPYISPKRDFHFVRPAVILTTVLMLFSGCVGYEPAPTYVPSPSTFDRAWNAAIGAARDEGVRDNHWKERRSGCDNRRSDTGRRQRSCRV